MINDSYAIIRDTYNDMSKVSAGISYEGIYRAGEKGESLFAINRAMGVYLSDCFAKSGVKKLPEWAKSNDVIWEQVESVTPIQLFQDFGRFYQFGMAVKHLEMSDGTTMRRKNAPYNIPATVLVNIQKNGNIDLFCETKNKSKIKTTIDLPSSMGGNFTPLAFCIDIRYIVILEKLLRRISRVGPIHYHIEAVDISLKSGSAIFHFGPHRAIIMFVKYPKDPEVKRPKDPEVKRPKA